MLHLYAVACDSATPVMAPMIKRNSQPYSVPHTHPPSGIRARLIITRPGRPAWVWLQVQVMVITPNVPSPPLHLSPAQLQHSKQLPLQPSSAPLAENHSRCPRQPSGANVPQFCRRIGCPSAFLQGAAGRQDGLLGWKRGRFVPRVGEFPMDGTRACLQVKKRVSRLSRPANPPGVPIRKKKKKKRIMTPTIGGRCHSLFCLFPPSAALAARPRGKGVGLASGCHCVSG